MAGTTGNRGYTYPTLADANDAPFYVQTLAEQVDLDVAALNNPQPVTPTYKSGWGDYPEPEYLSLVATRSASGLVGLSGLFARRGASLASTSGIQQIATLPEGYRPSRRVLTVVTGHGNTYGQCRIDIHPDGLLTAGWLTAMPWNMNTSWVSLAGVSYVAAS